MTDRVILGNPFMCLLYPFTTDSERITTHPFGMDDLELAEELLLDNHLFNILWKKFKKIQSKPNHLYPQISGSNLRSTIDLPNQRRKLQSTTFKRKSRKPSLRLDPLNKKWPSLELITISLTRDWNTWKTILIKAMRKEPHFRTLLMKKLMK